MDPDTQRLIERTRQRREMLNQRIAGMPEAAPRKRRTPVLENEETENVLVEKQNNQDEWEPHQDSPKRQCVRDVEQEVKPDTPAIRGVHSRIQDLPSSLMRGNEENGGEATPTPKPRKSVSSPPMERRAQQSPAKQAVDSSSVPSGRRGRFAALAQNINNWEDDLSHPVIHKEEEKKPRWQPPPKTDNPPASSTAVSKAVPSGKGPAPSAPAGKLTSSAAKSAATVMASAPPGSPKKTHAPPTPRSNVPGSPASNLARNSPLRSSKVCTPALSASTPAPSSTSIARPKDCDPSELPVSQRMSQMQEKLTPRMRPRQDEPTAYSVGARMSAWENMTSSNQVSNIKKVNPGEATPVTTKTPVSIPKPAAIPAGYNAPPENPPPPPAVKAGVSSKKSFRECIEERASQVLAKRGTPTSTPARADPAPANTPARATVTSPGKIVHSPTKVSAGTKSFQQLLAERSKDSSTNCSAMAAQSRADRMAELQAIQNRWKNGILRDDSSGTSSDESGKPSQSVRPKSPSPPVTEPKTPASSKREDARNKARADFNNKLAQAGLVDDSTPSKSSSSRGPVLATQTLPGSAKSTPQSQTTSSIYNLIRKREETVQQNNEDNKKVKFNDSFDDSDDDPDQKIPRSAARRAAIEAAERREQEELQDEEGRFKKPSAPMPKQDSEDPASSSDAGDEDFASSCRLPIDLDDDDISLKDFVSEAVRRESILPAKGQNTTSQSSLDSYGDDSHQAFDSEGSLDPPSSKHGGYRPDDESMDDDDEDINDRNAVDDLLDEAMDSTDDSDMDPKNVVMRRTGQPLGNNYDPDMDPNNVVMRRKTAQPTTSQRHQGRGMESTDDDDDDARPYSLQAYRKSANVHQHLMEPVVRKSRYANLEVKEEDIAMPSVDRPRRDDRRAVQDRIKELQELVQQEQNVIMQTSNALNRCCMGNSYFAGSAEQVECNRVLLIACQKRQCYMTEIQRLKDSGCLSHDGSGPHGSLTISDIRLPLKKEFVTKIGTSHDTTTHYFILLIRNGCQLICTQMLSTHDSMMRGSLDFPNLIKINGITGNFKLTMDIYGMSISREMIAKDKKKKTPKKKGFTLESPGGPMAVRTTSFSHVTSIELNMKNIDKTSFHLDRLPHLSPLYGQIFMRLKCLMEINVEERGFLTMFEDVSGFGAWHRRWCVLSGNKLCVWKYPDDESRKDPMAFIDLKRCITEKVGLVPRDICARPNTFEMVTVRQPLKGEHDTLITKTYNSTTMVRHQMSADSKEERIVWCNKINRTLANLRTWNADALKPMKSAESSSYR